LNPDRFESSKRLFGTDLLVGVVFFAVRQSPSGAFPDVKTSPAAFADRPSST
jgi:hypothetical protein